MTGCEYPSSSVYCKYEYTEVDGWILKHYFIVNCNKAVISVWQICHLNIELKLKYN
jgi:hypothetical protein